MGARRSNPGARKAPVHPREGGPHPDRSNRGAEVRRRGAETEGASASLMGIHPSDGARTGGLPARSQSTCRASRAGALLSRAFMLSSDHKVSWKRTLRTTPDVQVRGACASGKHRRVCIGRARAHRAPARSTRRASGTRLASLLRHEGLPLRRDTELSRERPGILRGRRPAVPRRLGPGRDDARRPDSAQYADLFAID